MKKILIISLSFSILVPAILGFFLYLTYKDLQKTKQSLSSVIQKTHENNTKIGSVSEQISVLDASISPEDKRWAVIKQVRKIIQEDMKLNNLGKELNIKDLTEIASAVIDYSEEYDVEKIFILAVMRTESAYNKRALSHAGAQGLMQLMPATAKECADDINKKYYNVHKPKDNIQLGVWYLAKMSNRFKNDIELVIRAYNAGPTMVEKVSVGDISDYPTETKQYLKKVLEWKTKYENAGIN